MTKVQAEAFEGIVWRWRSASQEATAHAALLDCAWTISPRVEDGAKREEQDFSDTVVLDIAGCEKLFGSPEKIAHDLRRVASEVGLEANVAVAGNPLAAVCAAQGFAGVTVIPAGRGRSSYRKTFARSSPNSFRVRRDPEALGNPHLRGICGPSRSCDCRAAGTGRAPLVAVGTRRGRSTADRQGVSLEFRRAHGSGLSGGIAGAVALRSESASRTVVRAVAYAHSRHRRDQSHAHARTQRLTQQGTNLSHPDDSTSGAGAR